MTFMELAHRRFSERHFDSRPVEEEKLRQIRELNELAAERGQSLAQMALAWILRDGVVTSVLAGASRPSQVLDNLQALSNTSFTEEELQKIDQICGL